MGDSVVLMLTGTPAAFVSVSYLESPSPSYYEIGGGLGFIKMLLNRILLNFDKSIFSW